MEEKPAFFCELLRALCAHLQHCPEDFFEDELGQNNFLLPAVVQLLEVCSGGDENGRAEDPFRVLEAGRAAAENPASKAKEPGEDLPGQGGEGPPAAVVPSPGEDKKARAVLRKRVGFLQQVMGERFGLPYDQLLLLALTGKRGKEVCTGEKFAAPGRCDDYAGAVVVEDYYHSPTGSGLSGEGDHEFGGGSDDDDMEGGPQVVDMQNPGYVM